MSKVENVILIAGFAGILALGFFLMKRLDAYLGRNRDRAEKTAEAKEPSCVMLSSELSREELLNEIERFSKSHKNTRIILYDSDVHGQIVDRAP